ncbi:hypothetical protein GOBAR_AA05065 [Gossypium barbadense]|uniref:Uncharacterized protein n=1 Tax=Gossypium barbadense TaxID=3634 RepID=A0A2P5YIU2_GOSBA|nr:hypothetical protein GOBAR_AA05065 [Gossypium barbadense]
MVFEIGRIGAHGHVARPCHSSFASPTPVYVGARPCCFGRLDHGRWARTCRMPVLIWHDCPRPCHKAVLIFALFSHGRIARTCCLSWYWHSLRHACGAGRVVLENLCSVSHLSLTYLSVPWSWWCEEFTLLIPTINFIKIRFWTSTIYLERTEFGMNYLNCAVWENDKYYKRDFSIRFRGGNPRVYCI